MNLPNGNYAWADAMRAASVADDLVRIKTLAAVGGALLDLVGELTPHEWNRLYAAISERMEIAPQKPPLVLIDTLPF